LVGPTWEVIVCRLLVQAPPFDRTVSRLFAHPHWNIQSAHFFQIKITQLDWAYCPLFLFPSFIAPEDNISRGASSLEGWLVSSIPPSLVSGLITAIRVTLFLSFQSCIRVHKSHEQGVWGVSAHHFCRCPGMPFFPRATLTPEEGPPPWLSERCAKLGKWVLSSAKSRQDPCPPSYIHVACLGNRAPCNPHAVCLWCAVTASGGSVGVWGMTRQHSQQVTCDNSDPLLWCSTHKGQHSHRQHPASSFPVAGVAALLAAQAREGVRVGAQVAGQVLAVPLAHHRNSLRVTQCAQAAFERGWVTPQHQCHAQDWRSGMHGPSNQILGAWQTWNHGGLEMHSVSGVPGKSYTREVVCARKTSTLSKLAYILSKTSVPQWPFRALTATVSL